MQNQTMGEAAMLGLFSKTKQSNDQNTPHGAQPEQEAQAKMIGIMREKIAEAQKNDPIAAEKFCAKELQQMLFHVWSSKDSKGVHLESILGIIGSLGGFACQMAMREIFIKEMKHDPRKVFTEVTDKKGSKYYMGSLLMRLLMEEQYSLWRTAAGGAQAAGCKQLPDMQVMIERVTQSIGSEAWGVPQLPAGHEISGTPTQYVVDLWCVIEPKLSRFLTSPKQWPTVYAIAAHNLILEAKGVIAPEIALAIVMESALITSKLDPVALRIPAAA